MINLTTGPVGILPEVRNAFNLPELSHRSGEFAAIYQSLTEKFCKTLHASEAFLLTGSGTLANDVMISQIKALNTKGLILSNGEFGERLTRQAERLGVSHTAYSLSWGQSFDIDKIESLIIEQQPKWLLFCHCESSTGIIGPLQEIKELAAKYNFRIYVDCMSTFCTMPLSLQGVAMATASSGKAIGTLAGLSFVFSNVEVIEAANVPVYLDLYHLKQCNGIPFTMSYNALAGLNIAVQRNLLTRDFKQIDTFSNLIYAKLKSLELLPFSKQYTRVFTISSADINAYELGNTLLQKGIKTSYQSDYLKKRNWLQLALFSNYEQSEIEYVVTIIEESVRFMRLGATD